jgi:hypothetical protein
MGKFNSGTFIGEVYEKTVDWNRAVLWRDRSISLSPLITSQFKTKGTKVVRFVDKIKKIKHEATVDALRENKTLKSVGQEQQFYFPINIFKAIPLKG